ncbi:MAG TPA: PQQ-dependent sugar dehydrogenase, partial [Polyangiaceae bacterium]|nr:PQQ-dependent sugar dehydrogenase [Polyangiaceae bacterium]
MRLLLSLALPLLCLPFAACGDDDDSYANNLPCPTGCAGAGGGGAGGGPAGPPAVARTVWATGLNNAWDVAFLPDGASALISERPGRISLRDAAGVRTPVQGPDDVLARGEGGLMGMTVDPEFATNRLVYTCFSHAGEPNDNRVVRWRLSDDNARLEQRQDIITGMPYSTGRHSGCRLLFGADGFLYVGTGD